MNNEMPKVTFHMVTPHVNWHQGATSEPEAEAVDTDKRKVTSRVRKATN